MRVSQRKKGEKAGKIVAAALSTSTHICTINRHLAGQVQHHLGAHYEIVTVAWSGRKVAENTNTLM